MEENLKNKLFILLGHQHTYFFPHLRKQRMKTKWSYESIKHLKEALPNFSDHESEGQDSESNLWSLIFNL